MKDKRIVNNVTKLNFDKKLKNEVKPNIQIPDKYPQLLGFLDNLKGEEVYALEKSEKLLTRIIDLINSKYPKNSDMYTELITTLIERVFVTKYGDSFILVNIPTDAHVVTLPFSGFIPLFYTAKERQILNNIAGVDSTKFIKIDSVEINSTYECLYNRFMHDRESFYEDDTFGCGRRAWAEYNSGCKQIVVGLSIIAGNNLVLLHNKANNNDVGKSLSLITGHVDFSPEYYTESKHEFLKRNMMREIEEELILEDINILNRMTKIPRFVMADNNSIPSSNISFYHIGLIYELRLDGMDAEGIKSLIKAKEDGVEVEVYNIKEFNFDDHPNVDSWVYSLISHYKRFI